MKKLVYLLLLAIIALPISAQSNTEAKALLDKVANHYKGKSSFYMKFNSQQQNGTSKSKENYAGEVYIKNDKYNLSVPKMDIKQIYDGSKLYTISQDQKEITVSKPDPNSDELLAPTKVFNMYQKGYEISFDKSATVNGKSITFVKLTPTESSDETSYVLVGIDAKNLDLVQLVEVAKNKNTTTVTIEKQLNEIIIPKSILSFDKSFYNGYFLNEI